MSDSEKLGSFKTNGNSVKRISTDIQDDGIKKIKLDQGGSINSTATSPQIGNLSVFSGSRKIKSRKLNDCSSTSNSYHLILDDTNITDDSGEQMCNKNFASICNNDEMILIRKQNVVDDGTCVVTTKNDVYNDERVNNLEQDSTLKNTTLLSALNSRSPVKRIQILAEAKKSLEEKGKFINISDNKKTEQAILSGTSSVINPQSTFTYSRVCSVSNITLENPVDTVNFKTVKNQPVMVTSKKIIPEVTQTTAKVSIGNTTISVPLLKPLNSTQIIHASSTTTSGSTETSKNILHTLQAGGVQSSQTQLSKILNIKRGQKVSQPTFVSLSQLQIKPVSTAKIVQAKVVSKKIPLHIQTVQTTKTSLMQQTAGVVAITSSKSDHSVQQQHQQSLTQILPSPQKQKQQQQQQQQQQQHISFVKEIPSGTIIKPSEDISPPVNANPDLVSEEKSGNLSSSQATLQTSDSTLKTTEKSHMSRSAPSGSSDDGSCSNEFLHSNVKVMHTAVTTHLNASNNLRPNLTNIEQIDQNIVKQQQIQQRINIGPTISIVRQNSPQLITTSSNMPATVSLNASDTVSTQPRVILTKSQYGSNTNITSTSIANLNSMTNSFPRHISLMLAKSSTSQQMVNTLAKNTLCVTTTTNKGTSTRLSLNTNTAIVDNNNSVANASQSELSQKLGGAKLSLTDSLSSGQSNRKVIQVVPGGCIYGGGNGGNLVQITKTKIEALDDDKRRSSDGGSSIEQLQRNLQMSHHQQQQQQQQQQQYHHEAQQQASNQHQQQLHVQNSAQVHAGQHSQQLINLQIQQSQVQQQQQVFQQIQNQHIQQQIQTQQQNQNTPRQNFIQQQQQQQHQQQRQPILHKTQIQTTHPQREQQQQQQHNITQTTTGSLLQDQHSSNKSSTETMFHGDNFTNINNTTNVENHSNSKPEESNNVLLKQLLQNSNNTPGNSQSTLARSYTTNTNVTSSTSGLPTRKVINVRAPSLGLVSSLEAQLARPVIPPVSTSEANSSTMTTSTPQPIHVNVNHDNNNKNSLHKPSPITSSISTTFSTVGQVSFTATSTAKSFPPTNIEDKSKQTLSTQLISKETSFVSKPPIKLDNNSDHSEQNIEIFSLSKPADMNPPTILENPTSSSQIIRNISYNAVSSKISKVVQEIKKSPEQQYRLPQSNSTQVQQQMIITRTYNNLRDVNVANVQESSQDKKLNDAQIHTALNQTASVNLNTNSNSQLTGPVKSVEETVERIGGQKCMNALDDNRTQSGYAKIKMETDNSTLIIKNAEGTAPSQQQQQQQQQQSKSATFSFQLNNATTTNLKPPIIPTAAPDSSLMVKSEQLFNNQTVPVTKDVELRKKRKRDQQKQRRQILNHVKESGSTSANAFAPSPAVSNVKKRSRKSFKLDEDYDSFIENLLLHLRQMQPLQILEPDLNISFDSCKIYGWQNGVKFMDNSTATKECRQSEKLNNMQLELMGDFGAVYLPKKKPFYDSKSFILPKDYNESSNSAIQNNFYDQEFSSFSYKTESEKLSSWAKIYKDRSIESPEIICNRKLSQIDPMKAMRLNMLQQESYPGLILMSNVHQRLGRMSPIIPLVNSMTLLTKRKKIPLKSLENDKFNHLNTKEEDVDIKHRVKDDCSTRTVILSLPKSSADQIMDMLNNLANILQMSTPISYKVLDNYTGSELDQACLSANKTKHLNKYLAIQAILNGRAKICRNCGKSLKDHYFKSCNDNNSDGTAMSHFMQQTQQKYFCSKVCYAQFRWCSEKKSPPSSSSTPNSNNNNNNNNNNIMLQHSDGFSKGHSLNVNNDDKLFGRTCLEEMKPNVVTNKSGAAVPKKVGFRYFKPKCFQPSTIFKRMSEKELRDLLFKMDITVSVNTTQTSINEVGGGGNAITEDRRQCVLCSQFGDGVPDGPSRLLNFEVDKWVHLNCALWSTEVYETINGGLMNFQISLQIGLNQMCNACHQLGATIKCYKSRCGAVYHLPCAIRDQCVFYQNKTVHCQIHVSRNDKDKELNSLTVQRRVYVERDENRQVAAILHHSELMNLLRVGSLIFLNVGQLLPHQLEAFHTQDYIYPIGYKIIRFYWSMRRPNKRCRYMCSITEMSGRPEFRIVVQESLQPDQELRDVSPKAVWMQVLNSIAEMRKANNMIKLHPEYIIGEDLFGLTEPSIVRIIESLPGVENLSNYKFKYGKNPLLDLPLALNPTGAARSEPKQKHHVGWKKSYTQRTSSTTSFIGHQSIPFVAVMGEPTCPYSKQFVHSKSSQYKKMKQEWRHNVFLARSKIQGLGLYAARDMEKHTMIIEYIGSIIRTEVSESREKKYEAKNRGIYMFRLDEDRVVDATLCGGLARYINHSCNPNCVTEIVDVDRELRIIIFAKRRINRGEELSYDYKFDLEEDNSKIPCMCGAPNCRKWMN